METQDNLSRRVNNKLGGWNLLDGSLIPNNWNGASFRRLDTFIAELCDPSSSLLDFLIEPTSTAYFPKLHLRAQERILALLLEVSTVQIQPVREKVSTLLALHRVKSDHPANASKDELLSATWLPRLAEAAAEAHGFSTNKNIIDQDATHILNMLPPVVSTSSSSGQTHSEVTLLQSPQDLQMPQWSLQWQGKSQEEKKKVDLEPVLKHFSKVGLTRHFPYEMLIGGRASNDIIKTYQINVPPCVKQMLAAKVTESDIDFVQKQAPKLNVKSNFSATSNDSSSNSRMPTSESGRPNFTSNSNSNHSTKSSSSSTSSGMSEIQRQQQAETARNRAAADKAKKEAQVKANMERVLAAGSSGTNNIAGNKRSRQVANVSQPIEKETTTNIKKPAIASSSGQPTSNPRNYNPSLHETKYTAMMNEIKLNAPSQRIAQILANNDFILRLKDFATGAPEMTGKIDSKTGQPKKSFPINLKVQDGILWAFILDYEKNEFTIKKKKRPVKRKK